MNVDEIVKELREACTDNEYAPPMVTNKMLTQATDLIESLQAQLVEYKNTGLTPEEVQKIAKAKSEGRLVVLPCKVGDLQEKYRELTKPEPDEAETYTTGYQNGIRNGQAELIAYLLQIDTGTKEAAEKVLPTCNVTKLPCAGCNPVCEHRGGAEDGK